MPNPRAWITDPAHPHYPQQGTIVHVGPAHVVLELSSWPIHGVRLIVVPANAVMPVVPIFTSDIPPSRPLALMDIKGFAR